MSISKYIEEIFIDYSHVSDIKYEYRSMTDDELSEEYKKIDIKIQFLCWTI